MPETDCSERNKPEKTESETTAGAAKRRAGSGFGKPGRGREKTRAKTTAGAAKWRAGSGFGEPGRADRPERAGGRAPEDG